MHLKPMFHLNLKYGILFGPFRIFFQTAKDKFHATCEYWANVQTLLQMHQVSSFCIIDMWETVFFLWQSKPFLILNDLVHKSRIFFLLQYGTRQFFWLGKVLNNMAAFKKKD